MTDYTDLQSERKLLLLGGAVAIVSFWSYFVLLGAMLRDWNLQIGNTVYPTGGHIVMAAIWMPIGTLAALGLAAVVVALWRSVATRVGSELDSSSDLVWWLGFAVVATASAVLIRMHLLHQTPLTDDEAAYGFAAELLASGRLWVPSHEMAAFFDRPFFINDGRYFPIYFWGWPALMVPGVWLGIPGFMAALYYGATVPALFLIGRRVWGRGAARALVVLFALCPFLLMQAATVMSQTATIFALSWALHFFLRSCDRAGGALDDFLFALFLCVGFWIRPLTTLGMGGGLVLLWLGSILRSATDRSQIGCSTRPLLSRPLAFLVPVLLLAPTFLLLQDTLYGSPWKTGYDSWHEFQIENDFHLSNVSEERLLAAEKPGFDFGGPHRMVAKTSAGLFRLSIDFFGWPTGFLLLALAIGVPETRPFWWMAIGGLLVFVPQFDGGIDTYGPVHLAELTLPILCLVIAGTRHWTRWLRSCLGDTGTTGSHPAWRPWRRHLPTAIYSFVIAQVVAAWIGFVPLRWLNVARIADNVALPVAAVKAEQLTRAVVFSPFPHAPPCRVEPSQHFVFAWPANDPDLENDVLWVHNEGLAKNRRLMVRFPGRRGYLMGWDLEACRPRLAPLEAFDHATDQERGV